MWSAHKYKFHTSHLSYMWKQSQQTYEYNLYYVSWSWMMVNQNHCLKDRQTKPLILIFISNNIRFCHKCIVLIEFTCRFRSDVTEDVDDIHQEKLNKIPNTLQISQCVLQAKNISTFVQGTVEHSILMSWILAHQSYFPSLCPCFLFSDNSVDCFFVITLSLEICSSAYVFLVSHLLIHEHATYIKVHCLH